MSKMSFMEKLLGGVAVEWMPLAKFPMKALMYLP